MQVTLGLVGIGPSSGSRRARVRTIHSLHTSVFPSFRGSFTVASSHKLVGAVSADIQDHEVVIFDFSEATHVDDSAAMVIKQLMDVAREERTELIVMGVTDAVRPTLQALSAFRRVPKRQIVSTLDEARRVAADLLQH